jgi:hypothetical protein
MSRPGRHRAMMQAQAAIQQLRRQHAQDLRKQQQQVPSASACAHCSLIRVFHMAGACSAGRQGPCRCRPEQKAERRHSNQDASVADAVASEGEEACGGRRGHRTRATGKGGVRTADEGKVKRGVRTGVEYFQWYFLRICAQFAIHDVRECCIGKKMSLHVCVLGQKHRDSGRLVKILDVF